jgi:enoyl-CoA hydratase/carnithine racemase
MEYTDILYAVEPQDHIARITMNKPEKRNPLGPNMIGEINHALCAARDDAEVRVVILTGAGKAFSAGGDLSQMGQAPRSGLITSFVELNLLFTSLGKPVIAMIDGPCMAGALGLVCGCHLAVAAETATFGTPEVNRGLWPMTIMANIFRNVGRKRAMEMILLGEKFDAAEAQRIGLVNRVVPGEKLEPETVELARKLAKKSPAVMKLGLDGFFDNADLPIEPQLRNLEKKFFEVVSTEDAREGLMAFMQKREPVWKGR